MKAHLRIDKDGVFIDGRQIPHVRAVSLSVDVHEAIATIEVVTLTKDLQINLSDVEITTEG